MNKIGAGGEMLAFFMFIFLLGIVAASVSWGVNSYFSGEYDFRFQEARLLNQVVLDCLEYDNFFLTGFDFHASCGVDRKFENLFVLVRQGDKEFVIGTRDFETQCGLNKKNYNYPRCFYSKLGDYEVVTGSNNVRERG